MSDVKHFADRFAALAGNVETFIRGNTLTSNGHDTDSQVFDIANNNNNNQFGIWVGPGTNSLAGARNNQESGNPGGCHQAGGS